jgi:hypothetical protein
MNKKRACTLNGIPTHTPAGMCIQMFRCVCALRGARLRRHDDAAISASLARWHSSGGTSNLECTTDRLSAFLSPRANPLLGVRASVSQAQKCAISLRTLL